MKSIGKMFEEDFQVSAPEGWFCYRLRDSPGAWSNTSMSRFTPKNICDFFLFTGRRLYGVECKSFKGKSMPYTNIGDHQLSGLLKMSVEKPVNAQGLFILNFRDLSETYAINAFKLNALRLLGVRKSFGIDEIRANGILIPQQLIKVHYRYDLTPLGEIVNK